MDTEKIIDSMWQKSDDEKDYKRWDELGRKIDAKLRPYRLYVVLAGVVLGVLAAIYC